MNKRVILCVFIALAITFSGFSDEITVNGTAPTFKPGPGSNNFGVTQGDVNSLNASLQDAFDDFTGDMQGMIDDMLSNVFPDGFTTSDLLQGFGASSVFASHGATMWAYSDYKSFSISVGSILGIKLPDGTGNIISNGLRSGDDIGTLIEEVMHHITTVDKLNLGVIPQLLNLHIGFNPSTMFKELPKNLFFGLRLGYFGYPGGFDVPLPIGENGQNVNINLNYNTFTLGATVNYQLIPTISIFGLIKWRGINIGSGFIYQKTNLVISTPAGLFKQEVDLPGSAPLDNLRLTLDPSANLNLDITTFTIPVEASTAITLLILNIPIGFGFDVGFGKSAISAGASSDINIEGNDMNYIVQDRAGSLSIDYDNSVDVKVFNWKLMTGIGITFGDFFIIDIPITYYFDDGLNVGVTIAVRF